VFFGRFSSSLGPIGIDFGSSGVKMLQLREQSGALEVVGAARVDVPLARVAGATPLPNASTAAPGPSKETPADPAVAAPPSAHSDRLAEQLSAACVSGGFAGRRCVISLARQDVCLQSIRLPKMPDDDLRQSAVWEASQRFGFDRNAMEVDFIRTGATLQSGESREEVVLIAASHAAIHARLEPVLDAGLRPVAVDTGFTALVRTFSRQVRREADRAVVRAIVEIGLSGSTVLILRGDQIAFCKPFAISGTDFNKAVAEHLQMDEHAAAELRAARIAAAAAEADPATGGPITDPSTDRAVYEAVRPLMGELVKEVTLCLRYYGVTFRGHPPERIILSGGDGLEPRLDDTLAKACKLPVGFDDTAPMLGGLIGPIRSTLNRTPGPAACWAVAAGLSLRGIGQKTKQAIQPPVAAKEAA
jgi:type IV pilus assembly protein PilM